MELTKEERHAIRTLERLSSRWPETLWLFSANGELNIMKYKKDGTRAVLSHGGMDANYSVASIDIPNDGGDW